MLIIGIAGGTGSGKTTVVHQIMNELPLTEVGIISQDSYYKDNSLLSFEERAKTNFDHPRAIDFELLAKHLKELKAGKTIAQPVYSFVTHNRTEDTVITHPRKVMIVEGILILADPKLREMFDIKIFVHADSDERLIRRLKRDIAERGRDMDEVLNRYQSTLKPMHEQFIEPTKAHADIIIPNDKYNTVAIDVVRAVINQRIL
ncbi:uridine kinase [Flavobacterium sp. LaA7.5]|nr:uridine kinase [Flavobacterium salilacus subsp. altitudinum]